ncbi:TetR/AcrR family transcriptional regulator [Peribacillus loiseleuriae]|uniref:TetR family transcriptional regulator n=1 Tax=Peribacillus loiseleuriae TaxID=1679170 RepID=A0A0K9GYG2_9BACI|nr:TetR/AcrR family transcriptional regulator [Peribacillus loiseleuriae]KMY51636.1 TetR family transcriptional regulator [Peribacillus loiseleuriae]
MGQRGREKGASGEESRALLLKIAADEFAQKGYYETKVSTIVKRANLTQPTFYLYFQSKEAIFQELVDAFRQNLFAYTKKSSLEPGIDSHSVPEALTKHLAAIFTYFVENPNLARIGFLIAQEAEELKKQLAAQMTDNLVSGQQNKYYRSNIDMSIVAESLVGIIERLTVTQLLQGKKQPEEIANEIVPLFLYGMLFHEDGGENHKD